MCDAVSHDSTCCIKMLNWVYPAVGIWKLKQTDAGAVNEHISVQKTQGQVSSLGPWHHSLFNWMEIWMWPPPLRRRVSLLKVPIVSLDNKVDPTLCPHWTTCPNSAFECNILNHVTRLVIMYQECHVNVLCNTYSMKTYILSQFEHKDVVTINQCQTFI